jgi:hypothetical protein
MSKDVLPDSRLKDETLGSVVANFEFDEVALVNGLPRLVKKKYRLEMLKIFCWNCGALQGYVPQGVMSWVSFLCNPCAAVCGEAAALLDTPDAEFWRVVSAEMERLYGRGLTQQELIVLVERSELPHSLQLLEKESPVPRTWK